MASTPAHPRILVVDDEPLLRWSVKETLGESGYQVAEAGDAAGAMRAFADVHAPSDVVLLDMRLPDSADFDVLCAMRILSPVTPVILMTAHGNPELSVGARELGAFTVLDKPFEMDDLPPLVERALASRPA